MRRIAESLLRGFCLAALTAALTAISASAQTLPGSGGAVRTGQTVVTAQVIEEATSPEEPGSEPPNQGPSNEVPSDEPSGTLPADDAAQPGVSAGQVNTGDVSTWLGLFLLLVFSGIVIVLIEIRKLYFEEE